MDHLAQLSTALNTPELIWDPDGTCMLSLDNNAIQLEKITDTRTLFRGIIGQLPPSASAELLENILAANLTLQAASGIAFAFEPESRSLILQGELKSDPTQLDCVAFCEVFIEAIEFNQNVLKEYSDTVADTVTAPQHFLKV
jgi:hypothetical protein